MAQERDVRALVELLADSPEPRFAVDLEGTIVHWNAAAAALFQVPAGRAVGQPCPAVLKGCGESGEAICTAACGVLREAGAGRSAAPLEMVVEVGQPPRRHWLRIHHLGLKNAAGQPLGVLHLVEDVQERRTRERVGERFLALTADRSAGHETAAHLTRREREVFRLLACGYTAREVAACLHISHATARTHTQRILAKLGTSSRIAALAKVIESQPPG